jgi:23S rRNA pseudouridine2605 synthase
MTTRKKSKSTASAVKRAAAGQKPKAASATAKPAPKTKKPGVQTTKRDAKATKPAAQKAAAPAKKSAAHAKRALTKTKEPGATSKKRKANAEGTTDYRIGEPVLDPIGDVISGEGHTYLGEIEAPAHAEMEAYRAETATTALDGTLEAEAEIAAAAARAASGADVEEPGPTEDAGRVTRPPAKLERLQKILSQAGIASRRHAEEMIVAGRVMVNGQVVTQLGSKADAARDHIRVDGKLLHGTERRRYFVLNKPKGYVTTVSDPEGRPTVMEFFAGMNERLYPVGRLDYQSEGLLLMTNDGELANLLTKAGSGVEKTYLVKVAGQPSEEELERLRGGVAIERGEAGSEKVRTAPARIRQVRVGDNPWYEVVLTEGRNRELRKMFMSLGHFAEKIRRVGYGPLVLDVEPGKLRELTLDEVRLLRLTAEGKMKPRRMRVDISLPKEAGRAPGKRGERPAWRDKAAGKRFDSASGRAQGRGGKPGFGERREGRPFSEPKPGFEKRNFDRPRFDKPRFEKPVGKRETGGRGGFAERPKFEGRKPFEGGKRPFSGGRPASGPKRDFDRPRPDRVRFEQPRYDRPRADKTRYEKPGFGGAPRGGSEGGLENAPRRPFRPQGERPNFKPGGAGRPKSGFGGKPGGFKGPGKPGGFGKFRGKGAGDRKFGGGRPGTARGGWKRS